MKKELLQLRKSNENVSEDILGLTHQRYAAIHQGIKDNKAEFEKKLRVLKTNIRISKSLMKLRMTKSEMN